MGLKAYVRYKGEFDLHALYGLIKGFFLARDYDFYERRYKDKGNEIKINMDPDREYDEYHKVIFSVFIHVMDYTHVQVVRGGKPKTLIRGRVQIDFSHKITYDYSPVKIFDTKNKTGKLLKKLYGVVTQREVDEYWDVLTLSLQQDLIEETKAFFKMYDSGN